MYYHVLMYVCTLCIQCMNACILVNQTPCLSDIWFIKHLVYPTPGSPNTWFIQHLFNPTPGLSDMFHKEQGWLDEPGPTVHTSVNLTKYRMRGNFRGTKLSRFSRNAWSSAKVYSANYYGTGDYLV